MYSITELERTFLETAQATASNSGTSIDVSNLSDFQAKATANASVGAAISTDIERYFQEVYPQTSSAIGCNAQLAATGATPQLPASPAFLQLSCQGVASGKTYIIPNGTLLTSTNKKTFLTVSNYNNQIETVITTDSNVLYAKSSTKGINTGLNVNDILVFSPPIVSTDTSSTITSLIVVSSSDGTNQESLSSAIERLIEINQAPLDNVRATDYKDQAIAFNNGSVTDAVVLTNNQITYPTNTFNGAIFLASGAPINNEILNKGLITGTITQLYSRTTNQSIINSTQAKFTAQYIMGSRPNVKTLITQGLTDNTDVANPFIKCVVTLQNGYNLNSVIGLDGDNFTISQLIQRETRRAICTQKFGATLEANILTGELISSKFLISAIQNQLDLTLGTSNTTGTIGAYLVDRTVFVYVDGTYAQPASIALNLDKPTNPADNLEWVYDVSIDPIHIYTNIKVETA